MTSINPNTLSQSPTPLAPEELAKGALVTYEAAEPERKAVIEQAIAEIDIADSNSIIFFGTKAQEQLTTVSDTMLEGVRNKDTGPAGNALNEMLVTLRGFDVGSIDPTKKPG